MTTRKSNPQRVEPSYLALMSAGRINANRQNRPTKRTDVRRQNNAKRKTDDEKQQNKPYLQRYTPEERASTKDKPKRNPHKIGKT